MKKDIEDCEDIKVLVNTFYEKVKADCLIGPIFTDKLHIDWEKHLPVMYLFWSNAIFFSGGYAGNPMTVHKSIHKAVKLEAIHFERWVHLFNETVDDLFEGEKANLAKLRAFSISKVMEQKILNQVWSE